MNPVRPQNAAAIRVRCACGQEGKRDFLIATCDDPATCKANDAKPDAAANRPEPLLSVRGNGYAIEVNEHGLWIEREGAPDHGGFLVVPLAEIAALGEVVDRAYAAGKESGIWP